MKYTDGATIEPGDMIQIDGRDRGKVIASMDTDQYLPGAEHWSYLGIGIMVETDFAGKIHYTESASDQLELIERAKT